MAILEYEMTATKEQYENSIAESVSMLGDNIGMCTIPPARYDAKGLISYWRRKRSGKLIYVERR